MSRTDPKHGRWILPLVIGGLVGFTYLFVNALPPGADDTTANGTDPTATTAPESNGDGDTENDDGEPPTTEPGEASPFITAINDFATRGAGLAEEAQTINTDWDNDEAEFAATRDNLTSLQNQTGTLATDITEAPVPPEATEAWATVMAAADEMEAAAAEMVTGLVDAPGPEQRLAALEAYTNAAADLATGLDLTRSAVGG